MDLHTLLDIITIVGIGSYAFGQWRAGRKEVKVADVGNANSTIELFKNRADGLEDELDALRNEFEAYKKEMSIKEEASNKHIAQQEELIKTYDAILKNRNPELEKILAEIRDYLKVLKETGDHNKTILDSQVKREQKIDSKN